MRRSSLIGCAVVMLVSSGCYHATIETGRTPSPVTVERSFASGWIYGLVPPSVTDVASKCADGVAKVETKQSFVNGLVAALTFGIYTPMNVKVTCAAKAAANGGTVIQLKPEMPAAEAEALLEAAAVASNGSFFVTVD